MSTKDFYSSPSYRAKQSARTKANWQAGVMDFLIKARPRSCARDGCRNTFVCPPADPKRYCSPQCAAIVNNSGRKQTHLTREKIRNALSGRKYPERYKKIPKYSVCLNPNCQKKFELKFWRPSHKPIKYCGRLCAIRDVGSRPTSPRASRGLAGIRKDISDTAYFFSRWEANYARLMNYLNVKWVHQPRTFQLRAQRYTPDFYLPETGTYIEIKNFLSDYSRKRDEEFRQLYPTINLKLILKEEYLALQNQYALRIPTWEYSFPSVRKKIMRNQASPSRF